MGGVDFVKQALQETAVKVKDCCDAVEQLDHPQMSFILLRQCNGTCRVVHLLRASTPAVSLELASIVDASMMETIQRIAQTPFSAASMTQLILYYIISYHITSYHIMLYLFFIYKIYAHFFDIL